ncbi:MAG: right-handed parallel beta-helix repeat-containing protein [Acidobacteria bacterium]|nr:right-handed parallel beta-helix repeat-containing protein [Acidobacteriota bacterium]
MNQCQYVFIEDSDIHGAEENAIDGVAIQYGHIRRSHIHDGGDWAAYLKGGSAYFVIEGNIFYDAVVGGFTAGQGTGLEYMVSPWLHYEAMDIKVINNLVHHVDGAAFGVNGGLRILIAHNTAYHIGLRSHLFETVFGSRSCDGDIARCQSNLALGAWGVHQTEFAALVPDRSVYVYNNLFFNPQGVQSQWQHLTVFGPGANPAGAIPVGTVVCDQDFRMAGNWIWNGPADLPLGIGDDQGCGPSHPTCSETALRTQNRINQAIPDLTEPSLEDFRPDPSGNMADEVASSIPNFDPSGQPSPPLAPVGTLSNQVQRDFSGATRSGAPTIGAYQIQAGQVLDSFPLVLPHWTFVNGAWDTVLALVNRSNVAATVEMTAFDSTGNSLGSKVISIPAGKGWRNSLISEFPNMSGLAGWLGLNPGGADVTGLLTFTFLSSGGTSSLSLADSFSSQLTLSGLREDSSWISGLALVNLASTSQSVSLNLVSLIDGSGQQVQRNLAPGEKWVTLLRDLFSGPIPTYSFVQVKGSAALTGFALSFSNGNSQIVAVPGH